MNNKHYKKLKLIWMIVLISALIHLGWLLIELQFTRQSLAEEYGKIRNGIEQKQEWVKEFNINTATVYQLPIVD